MVNVPICKSDLEEVSWDEARKLSDAEVDELLLPILHDMSNQELRNLHDLWTCTGDTLVLADRWSFGDPEHPAVFICTIRKVYRTKEVNPGNNEANLTRSIGGTFQ